MKYILFLIIITLRLIYHPAHHKNDLAPFAKPSSLPPYNNEVIMEKQTSINGTLINPEYQNLGYYYEDMIFNEKNLVSAGVSVYTYSGNLRTK